MHKPLAPLSKIDTASLCMNRLQHKAWGEKSRAYAEVRVNVCSIGCRVEKHLVALGHSGH